MGQCSGTLKMNTHTVIIAFDFGMKKIGSAIGQTITGNTRPLKIIPAKEGIPQWSTITELVKKWRADAIVVGIPFNMDGSQQNITFKAQQFIQELQALVTIPIYTMDERLTSVAAREILFQQGGYKALQDGQVDCVAAQLILENWLNLNKST